MVFGSIITHLFIAWHLETASTHREREFGTSSVHVRLMAFELAPLEKKEEEEDEERK